MAYDPSGASAALIPGVEEIERGVPEKPKRETFHNCSTAVSGGNQVPVGGKRKCSNSSGGLSGIQWLRTGGAIYPPRSNLSIPAAGNERV